MGSDGSLASYNIDDTIADSYSDERTTKIIFLCFATILVVVLFLSKWLEDSARLRTHISEPAMTLLVGMFCSLIIRLLNESDYEEYQNHYQSEHDVTDDIDANAYDDQYYNARNFDESKYASKYLRAVPNFFLLFPSKVFFLALLPPILFNSGYELQRELFYRHFSAIVLFSIVGTALSAFCAGSFLWFLGTKGWLGDAFDPTPLELLTFGAMIAATDTVSVVGVLQRKRVDPHLFSLVFGESALNDAVALVLFKTLADFLRQNSASSDGSDESSSELYKNIGKYLLDLLVQCAVSPILGLVFASLMGLAFKHGNIGDHMLLELSLYILPVYMPFMLAELFELSGMITIFFTGIFARRYIEPNVSEETGDYARILFKLLAFLAEICIFLELGLSVCGMHKGHFSWLFVSWAFIAALLGRAIGVYPLSFLYNLSLTRPVMNTGRATTITVEMITKGKCESCTSHGLSDCNSNTEAHHSTPGCDEADTIFSSDTIGSQSNPNVNFAATKGKKRTDKEKIGPSPSPSAPSSPSSVDSAADESTLSTTSSAENSIMSDSYYNLMPNMVKKRETPHRKRDKIIPVKFMHILWFAGLRGAVAYACAREFPDVYGHRDEFIAATMVIVVITIVFMGGATEPLMDRLGVRMNIDNEDYMRSWHQQRKLKGRFLHFEYHWIYRFVVKENSMRLMDESCGYVEHVDDSATGIGIDPSVLPRNVFDPRLTTNRRKTKGRRWHGRRLCNRERKYPLRHLYGPEMAHERTMVQNDIAKMPSLLDQDETEEDAGNLNIYHQKLNSGRQSDIV